MKGACGAGVAKSMGSKSKEESSFDFFSRLTGFGWEALLSASGFSFSVKIEELLLGLAIWVAFNRTLVPLTDTIVVFKSGRMVMLVVVVVVVGAVEVVKPW